MNALKSYFKKMLQNETYIAFFKRATKKTNEYRGITFLVGILIIGALTVWAVNVPLWPEWTGLNHKSAWDLADLLIVPLALAVIAYFFNKTERENERELADERRAREIKLAKEERENESELAEKRIQETALQNYFDKMTELLLEPNNLRDSEPKSEVRSIARARTLTVLRSLNGVRKGSVLQFLYESNLINDSSPIVGMRGADLAGANLGGANLEGANLEEANLEGANLEVTILAKAKLAKANLAGATLTGATLAQADLAGVTLTGANLQRTILIGANLTGAILRGANLRDVLLTGATLTGAKLAGANLEEAILEGVILQEASLIGAYLKKTKLAGVNLVGANLISARLEQVNLTGAKLAGANLRNVILVGADLSEAYLKEAYLEGADLRGANLERTDLETASYDGNTKWPADFDPKQAGAENVDEAPQVPAKSDSRQILDEELKDDHTDRI